MRHRWRIGQLNLGGTLSKRYLGILVFAFTVPALADNVALGKPVTITGEFGVVTCCWPDPHPPAALSTITDGVSLAEGTQWQTDTVWWDEWHPPSLYNIIEIDLQGLFLVTDLLIQADNNDAYAIDYRDSGGTWTSFVYAPIVPGAGMRTRAVSVGPIVASGFRIDAFDGDEFYSVSEFQANGVAVPEPSAFFVIAAGIALVIFKRRAKQ